ncbi:MAG: glycosyltransferase family 39 protein, partial [Anaerolineales bacterium]
MGKNASIITLLLIIAIWVPGTLIRLNHLTDRTMGHIEIYAPNIDMPYELSDPRPRMSLLKTVTGTFWEPHPPAWYILMWPWTKWFGTELFVLRLPSLIFGAMSILLVYMLASQVETRLTALISMGLLAFNGHQILWSQIARPYILSVFIGLLATLLLLKSLQDGKRQKFFLLIYSLVSMLGLTTTYYYWPFYAVHILWVMVLTWIKDNRQTGLFLSQLLTLILASPLVALAIFQSKDSYLLGNPLVFLRNYFSFGFLFEPDLDAGLFNQQPLVILLVVPLFGLLLFLIGWLNRGKNERTMQLPKFQHFSKAYLFVATSLAVLVIFMAAFAFNTKDPSKTNAILLSSVMPVLLLMLAYLAQRRSSITVKIGSYLDQKLFLGQPSSLVNLLAILPILMIAAISLFIPFFASRQALLFVPFLLIVIARGTARLLSNTRTLFSYATMLPLALGL